MTANTEVLLDKLYNLRGSDSEILREMDRQKNKAEETRVRTTEEKSKLQSDISEQKKQKKPKTHNKTKKKQRIYRGNIYRNGCKYGSNRGKCLQPRF